MIFCLWQERSSRVSRCYVTCFNVDPAFASAFTFPKSKGGGEFKIKYMHAGFDRVSESGEFFIEFDEMIWEHKLAERFVALGAGQVNTITFEKDGGDSAANALLRIDGAKSVYTRGTCPPQLEAKVEAKLKAQEEQKAASASKEFDEKTAAAIQQSLEDCKDSMVKQVVKLEEIGSQVVKLEGIEHSVCAVIPDYQRDNALLKDALCRKTAACDSIEGKLAYKTRIINQQDAYIAKLEQNVALFADKEKTWIAQQQSYMQQITVLQEQLGLTVYLKQALDRANHTADILSSTLAEERSAKRSRAD